MLPQLLKKKLNLGIIFILLAGLFSAIAAFVFGLPLYSILLFSSLTFIGAVTSGFFVSRRFTTSIEELTRATREIAEGKLDRPIHIGAKGVSDLAMALERIRRELAEREREEKALKESEKKYRAIFEGSKDVIFICSPDGRFVDINPAGADLFGCSSTADLRAIDPAEDLYDRPEEYQVLRSILERQGFVLDHEVTMKRKDGEKLTVLVTAALVRDEQGAIAAYRGAFHNVTQKRLREQQFVQSQKMEAVGRLAGGMAHDINNVLTAIMGYGNLLLLDTPEESPARDHAEHILSSSERAANLTRSLLAFSGKQMINPRPVNLVELIRGLEDMLGRIIGRDIELKTEFEAPEVTALADRGQIEQALVNVCKNARDAMRRGGVLTVRVSTVTIDRQSNDPAEDRPGTYARIALQDTGAGIDDAIRGKIFEPFFTTKDTGKGTGLGLSIVHGIIKQHNGYVGVESRTGKGTVVALYLPLVERAGRTIDNRQAPGARGGTETIVVAEDDTEVRNLVRVVLSENGYHVIEAADGQDALAVLSREKRKIHLLLLDVVMPKKNGKEVYQIARDMDAEVKTIFMSGYASDIIDKKGIPARDLNFISKPIAPLELLAAVREVLDR